MSLERIVSKYIDSAQQVLDTLGLARMPAIIESRKVEEVVQWARAYLEDAEYYREKEKLEVSLTSVAYCEGLLEALKLLGAVNFEWPTKPKEPRKEE
jgi:FAD synthetase